MWADGKVNANSNQGLSLTNNGVTALFPIEFNHKEIKRQDWS